MTRLVKETLIFITPVLMAVGCRSTARLEYFLIQPVDRIERAERSSPYTLRVRPVKAPDRYRERIVYRLDEHRMGFYESSRWIEDPTQMVAAVLVETLRQRGFFARVATDAALPRADLTLDTTILSFEQVVDGDRLIAECALAFELTGKDDNALIWSGEGRAGVPQKDKGRFAAAMEEAANRAVAQAIVKMEAALNAAPEIPKEESREIREKEAGEGSR